MTEYVVLDTDAFSNLLLRKPASAGYGHLLAGKVPALAFVTLAEARYGALHAGWGDRRRTELEQFFRRFLMIPFTDELATVWARLKYDARRNGHPLAHREQSNDLWAAACGVLHQAPVLTCNVRHFDGLPGLRVLDGS